MTTVAVDPQVFITSAIADVGTGVFAAMRDLQAGRFAAGGGAETRGMPIRKACGCRWPLMCCRPRARVEHAADNVRAGRIEVAENHDGPEFATPAA